MLSELVHLLVGLILSFCLMYLSQNVTLDDEHVYNDAFSTALIFFKTRKITSIGKDTKKSEL